MNNFQCGSDMIEPNALNIGAQLNFVARNGCKNEGHQSEQGVQQEDVKTTLCP